MVKESIIGYLKDILSGNITISDILSGLKDKIVNGLKDIIGSLTELKNDFVNNLVSLLDSIKSIPDKFKDLLVLLFVPDRNPLDEVQKIIESKFAIIGQIDQLFKAIVFSGSGTLPSFEFTYMGQTVSIVDFQSYKPYMTVFHGIIIAICYYRFFSRMRRRLPGLIGGFY